MTEDDPIRKIVIDYEKSKPTRITFELDDGEVAKQREIEPDDAELIEDLDEILRFALDALERHDAKEDK